MLEGMKPVGYYIYESKRTAPDTDTITFVGPKVRRGQVVELWHGSVVNYTTAGKMLLVGKRNQQGASHYYSARKNAQYYQAHLEGRVVLIEGDEPVGVVESPTASDVLYCAFRGIIYEYPE